MGTIGDLVTLGVVGGIGYLVLKSGALNNLGGIAANTVTIPAYEELTPDQKKIVDTTDEINEDNVTKLLKDDLKTANEQAITTAIETNTVLNNADKLIQYTPWSGIWKLVQEKSAEAATENQLKEQPTAQPTLEVEKPATEKPLTKIDQTDANIIDTTAKNIGEGLKSAGLLGSDWTYTGINLKFLGL